MSLLYGRDMDVVLSDRLKAVVGDNHLHFKRGDLVLASLNGKSATITVCAIMDIEVSVEKMDDKLKIDFYDTQD